VRSFRRIALCLFTVVALASCATKPPIGPPDKSFGGFDALIRSEWDLDGRTMTLLTPVVFRDLRQGKVWTAPEKSLIDGASIPKFLWSLVGGPYEGQYRDASVTHDYECCVKLRPWRQVHRMFYYAMRARGVGETRALWMYWAVYHLGPRWPLPEQTAGLPAADSVRPRLRQSDARKALQLIEARPTISLSRSSSSTGRQSQVNSRSSASS
jgi:hypothetical protein